jgi:hypothetical protein
MRKKPKKKIKDNIRIALGILLKISIFFICFELILTGSGLIFSGIQEYNNRITGSSENRTIKVLIIGDSLSAAVPSRTDWPSQLEAILNNKSKNLRFKIINKAIAGVNFAYVLKSFDSDIDKYSPDIVISMIGSNDGQLDAEEEYEIISFKNLKMYKLLNLALNLWLSENRDSSLLKSIGVSVISKSCERFKRPDINESQAGESFEEISKISKLQGDFEKFKDNASDADLDTYFDFANFDINKEIVLNETSKMMLNKIILMQMERSIKSNITKDRFFFDIGIIFSEYECYNDALVNFNEAYRLNENNEIPTIQYLEIKNIKYASSKKNNIKLIRNEDLDASTRSKYLYVYSVLKKKGIRYYAMQYPTLDIGILKNILDNKEDVVYISNKENFEKALASSSEESIFDDLMGKEIQGAFNGDWGHLTPKGNSIVADNAAIVMLKDLKIE